MLQWHVEEYALDGRQAFVLLLHRSFDAQFQGDLVFGKCIRSIAIDVSAKLVKQ